jgi:hypothetical protein
MLGDAFFLYPTWSWFCSDLTLPSQHSSWSEKLEDCGGQGKGLSNLYGGLNLAEALSLLRGFRPGMSLLFCKGSG